MASYEKHKKLVLKLIKEELKEHLNEDPSWLWLAGYSQGVPTVFKLMTELEFNIGGLLLMMNGPEPVVKIAEVKDERLSIPIIYFASQGDQVIPIHYVRK